MLRVCAGPDCETSLEGMRKDAKWCSGACAKRAARSGTQGADPVERFYHAIGRVQRRRRPDRGQTQEAV